MRGERSGNLVGLFIEQAREHDFAHSVIRRDLRGHVEQLRAHDVREHCWRERRNTVASGSRTSLAQLPDVVVLLAFSSVASTAR